MRLDAVEARGGLKVDLQVEGIGAPDAPVRQELYQIAQEALNNALKHARAQNVRVLLQFQATSMRLEIGDGMLLPSGPERAAAWACGVCRRGRSASGPACNWPAIREAAQR